jgi:beta-lactamase class A
MPQRHKRYRIALVIAVAATLFQLGLARKAGSGDKAYASTPPVTLYGSAPNAPDSELQEIIETTVKDLPGTWGVAVKKLDTGQYAVYNGDQQQVSASLYKVWVLSELYRQAAAGTVGLDDNAVVTSDDAYEDDVAGELRLDVGSSITLRQAANLMITASDNTTAHLLVRILGQDNVSSFMQQNGLTHSVLDWSGVGDNLTTPLDVLREMELLATSRMVSEPASQEMIGMMLDQQINDLLPPGMPDGTPFAHKTGALDYLLHDAGIVYSPAGPYIIVVMASQTVDYATPMSQIPELSRKVYEYFTSRSSTPALYFPQTHQSVGHDFLKFWHSLGGLQAFGYPIGPQQMQGNTLVQYFERARLEWHPENAGAGGPQPQVVIGLVGQERAAQLRLSWHRGGDPGGGKYFDATGQVITGGFLDYWLNNGGERAFGMPISPATRMVSPADGKTYLTQWFQRARMEFHPDMPGGSQIVLGRLGSEMQSSK